MTVIPPSIHLLYILADGISLYVQSVFWPLNLSVAVVENCKSFKMPLKKWHHVWAYVWQNPLYITTFQPILCLDLMPPSCAVWLIVEACSCTVYPDITCCCCFFTSPVRFGIPLYCFPCLSCWPGKRLDSSRSRRTMIPHWLPPEVWTEPVVLIGAHDWAESTAARRWACVRPGDDGGLLTLYVVIRARSKTFAELTRLTNLSLLQM